VRNQILAVQLKPVTLPTELSDLTGNYVHRKFNESPVGSKVIKGGKKYGHDSFFGNKESTEASQMS
jgi:hypothetical protein